MDAATRRTSANPLAEHVWWTRYRFEDEPSIHATFDRVARALAEPEPRDRERWARRFRDALDGSDHAAFAAIYRCASDLGLKGCTVFRPNAVTGRSRVETASRRQRGVGTAS